MNSELHRGERAERDRVDEMLKNLHWRCRDCHFLTKSDDQPNFCSYCRSDRMRPAAIKVDAPQPSLIEQTAIVLWHRFAPESHMEWPEETHAAEYRDAAEEVLKVSYARLAELRDEVGWLKVELASRNLRILGLEHSPQGKIKNLINPNEQSWVITCRRRWPERISFAMALLFRWPSDSTS